MIKLKSLLLESFMLGESLSHDYDRIYEKTSNEFNDGHKHQSWKLVPARQFLLVWSTFAKYGRVEKNQIMDIWEIVKENVIKIEINTNIWKDGDPMFFQKDSEEEVSEEENDRFAIFISDLSGANMVRSFAEWGGNARYSDGSKELVRLLEKGYGSENEVELLMNIDNIMNFVHGLGPMAKWFVEGGVKTLDAVRHMKVKGINLQGRLS